MHLPRILGRRAVVLAAAEEERRAIDLAKPVTGVGSHALDQRRTVDATTASMPPLPTLSVVVTPIVPVSVTDTGNLERFTRRRPGRGAPAASSATYDELEGV